MIHIFTGSNTLMIDEAVASVVQDFVARYGDLALERIDASETSLNDLLQAVGAVPFLAEKKLVVLRGVSENKEVSGAIEQLLQAVAEEVDVVLVEGKVDKRGAYYKLLKKQQGFKEFGELDEYALMQWVQDVVSKAGGTISRADAQYLMQRVGDSQLMLQQETDKLVSYNPKVTRTTIDTLTDAAPHSTIFSLIDAAFSGDRKRALALYEDQRKQLVEPYAILGMMVWQLHSVSVALYGAQVPTAELAKGSGFSPFVIDKSRNLARKLTRTRLKELVQELLELEYAAKTSNTDIDEGLRLYIIKLAE